MYAVNDISNVQGLLNCVQLTNIVVNYPKVEKSRSEKWISNVFGRWPVVPRSPSVVSDLSSTSAHINNYSISLIKTCPKPFFLHGRKKSLDLFSLSQNITRKDSKGSQFHVYNNFNVLIDVFDETIILSAIIIQHTLEISNHLALEVAVFVGLRRMYSKFRQD